MKKLKPLFYSKLYTIAVTLVLVHIILNELVLSLLLSSDSLWVKLIEHLIFVMIIIPILFLVTKKVNKISDELKVKDKKLSEIEIDLKHIFNNPNACYYQVNILTGDLKISTGMERLVGISLVKLRENLLQWKQVIHPDDVHSIEVFQPQDLLFKKTKQEYRIIRPDGNIRWVEEHRMPIFNDAGKMIKLNVILHDVTETKKYQQELKRQTEQLAVSEEKYRSVVELSPNIILIHRQGKIVYVNPATIDLLGTGDNLLNQSVDQFIQPNKVTPTRKGGMQLVTITTQHGQTFDIEMATAEIIYEGNPATLNIGRDITWQKRKEDKLKTLAYYDELTELPNRRLLLENLKKSIARSKRHHHMLSVLFIDLDGFKRVNDTLGHEMGDSLLIEVGKKLTECVREGDTVSRLGGDEFIILLEEITESEASEVSERIIEQLSEPFLINEETVQISPSIGISIFPNHGETDEDLIKHADKAMYFAKKNGKNNFKIYNPEIEISVQKKFDFFEKIVSHFQK
ncbi:sensor domain-containing protein [Halalkalibacter urbisdiaboli]|uniref:sensor domain-containing protein n=1 Tax=Halalkalibacter urbisdiaboli TaxID=1960589 RepID=UPI000B454E8D|nr:sensor domain-containing diguanylate cyclase [Halalkalibacter urbisdiaboli]